MMKKEIMQEFNEALQKLVNLFPGMDVDLTVRTGSKQPFMAAVWYKYSAAHVGVGDTPTAAVNQLMERVGSAEKLIMEQIEAATKELEGATNKVNTLKLALQSAGCEKLEETNETQ